LTTKLSALPGFDAGSLISLLVIFGVLIAANVAVRRWRGRLPGRGAAGIELVGARALGGQSALLLIEVQGARYLVGTGRAGVAVICPLCEQAARDVP
jgi:flagellar biogenesis protein FliO